jgi:ABC-type nitrate/sulfonate/bicarbonate transport system substrate-binding protein
MIVTIEAGLFAKHGLDVTARRMGSAKNVVAGLMSGERQFGNLAAPSMLRADLTEGADAVFVTLGINQQFLVTRPGLTERSQLQGARLGHVGDGALSDILTLFLKAQLAREGIQTELVPISNDEEARLSILHDGTCDGVTLTPPVAIKARRAGCHFLIDMAEYGFNYALGGIGARRSYIDANADIARRFVTAYVEGLHRYRTDREFTIEVQQRFSALEDRSLAEETYDITMPGMPKAPYPTTTGLEKALEIIGLDLPAAAKADAAQFVEPRFVRELDESGFISRLYGEP